MPQGLPVRAAIEVTFFILEEKELEVSETSRRKKRQKKSRKNLWPLAVFFLAFALSVGFSLAAQLIMTGSVLAVALILIFVLLLISIVFDIIGVAVTKCDDKAFFAMASRKVKGAKKSLFLLRNADRVNSICCDIIGEVLSILSGALGMVIVGILLVNANGVWEIMTPVLIGAAITAMTAGGKAVTKTIAIKKAHGIVFAVGRILSIFGKG